MIELCEIGERPPLGEVPRRMHAYLVRQNRFGQPRDAWRREIIPTPTLGPTMLGTASSTCTMVPSWMLLWAPITIGAMSPRSTVANQTLDSGPRVVSPKTTAPGAMKAVG